MLCCRLGPSSLDFVLLLSVAYLGVTMVGLFFLVNPYLRGRWLKADRIAAGYVGPLTMLGVLEKIQGFHLTELEGGRFNDKPSLAERIAKLREYWSKTSGLTAC